MSEQGAVWKPEDDEEPKDEPLKTCVKCGEPKPMSKFRRASYGSLSNTCNDCIWAKRRGEIA